MVGLRGRATDVVNHGRMGPKVGTNLALMNALTHELFAIGWVDDAWVAAHTVGVDDLRATVDPCTPEWAGAICGVPPEDIRRAARIFGESETALSTGRVGLLRDLQDLHLLGTLVQTTLTLIGQATQGLRDEELLAVAQRSVGETGRQLSWFTTRMKAAAPQVLIVVP